MQDFHDDEFDIEDSDAFMSSYREADRFLKMPPVVENPFPNWARSDVRKREVTTCVEDRTFWQLLNEEALAENGFDEADIPQYIFEAVAQRILALMASRAQTPWRIWSP